MRPRIAPGDARLGSIPGAVPPFVLLAGGVLRLTVISGVDTTLDVLSAGAIIPGRGIQSWAQFGAMTSVCALIGIASRRHGLAGGQALEPRTDPRRT